MDKNNIMYKIVWIDKDHKMCIDENIQKPIWRDDNFKYKQYNWRVYPASYKSESYSKTNLIALGDKSGYDELDFNGKLIYTKIYSDNNNNINI